MKVYEIFEAIEITPSATLGADGKPAGFNVIDTDNNRTLKTFPDEGSAEEFRDQERTRRTPAQSPDDSNNKDNTTGRNQRRGVTSKMSKDEVKELIRKYGGRSNWLFGFINVVSLGHATYQSIDDYKTLLTKAGCDRYGEGVGLARDTVGIRITGALATTIAGLAGGLAAVKLLKYIATVFTLVPGAGWLAAAIAMGSSWVIGYAIERVLTKPKVQNFIGYYAGNLICSFIDRSCGVEESIEEDANTVFESMKSDAAAEIKKSFADIVKDPRGKQELIKVKKAIKSKAS
jgi:hypothetical protein